MIKVTVQTEDRLYAINKLASAIESLAKALCTGTKVEIANNVLHGEGISIDTADKVTRTEIMEKEK